MTRRRNESRRQDVLDAYRAHLETIGNAPTCRELGDKVGMSHVGAWKHVRALTEAGIISENGGLSDHIDLTSVPTDKLRAELARRGFTMDALKEPKLLDDEGRPCAANGCRERIQRGRLFCREHWYALPYEMRAAIHAAFSARRVLAYSDAVEAARDHLGGFTRVVERVA
jgi:hypothetical protein